MFRQEKREGFSFFQWHRDAEIGKIDFPDWNRVLRITAEFIAANHRRYGLVAVALKIEIVFTFWHYHTNIPPNYKL